MANMAEIAKILNISKTAVSLYLNDPETKRVSDATKARISKAVQEHNYRPHMIAKSLSSARTKTISVILPYNRPLFRSSFVNEMLSGLQFELFKHGYSIIFLPTKGEDSSIMVKNYLKGARGYDGIILFGTRYCTRELLEENVELLMQTGTPFSAVNMPELPQPINQVILRTPMESNPIQFFIQSGHRDILLVVGREHDPESLLTIQDYQEVLRGSSIAYSDEQVIFGDYEYDITRSEIKKAINHGIPFTAVYCLSDTMAVGVYEALKEHNLRIPEDVSVIGTNDSFFACYTDPPLTTLRKQVYKAGEEAAKSLLHTLQTNKAGRKIWLDSELIFRNSTRLI
jgi:DNA-binding LacI/PurR family transcriptional regulator